MNIETLTLTAKKVSRFIFDQIQHGLLDSPEYFPFTPWHFSLKFVGIGMKNQSFEWMIDMFAFCQCNERMNILHEFRWKTVSIVMLCYTFRLSIDSIFLQKNLCTAVHFAQSHHNAMCRVEKTRSHKQCHGMAWHTNRAIP